MKMKNFVCRIAVALPLMMPTTAFADPSWTGQYGQTQDGSHTQQTYDFGSTGSGQGNNGSNNTNSNDSSGSSSSSTSSNPTGNPSNGTSYPGTPPTTTSQDIAESALQIGVDQAMQNMGNGGDPNHITHLHLDPGIGGGSQPGDCTDCGEQNKLFVSSTWNNNGSSGTTLFSYTPLSWDWSFTNSDFPSASFSVTKGPRDSINEHFTKSGYWHVSYNEYGTYTWGYYEYRMITVWTNYGTGKAKTTETISIPHVTSVESHYKGWQHLTDFRLSDWDISHTFAGTCPIPGPVTQQVDLNTTTSQEVAK